MHSDTHQPGGVCCVYIFNLLSSPVGKGYWTKATSTSFFFPDVQKKMQFFFGTLSWLQKQNVMKGDCLKLLIQKISLRGHQSVSKQNKPFSNIVRLSLQTMTKKHYSLWPEISDHKLRRKLFWEVTLESCFHTNFERTRSLFSSTAIAIWCFSC